jgi:hypothetical protein
MEAASNADAAVRPLQTTLPGTVSATASTKAYIWSCGAVHARDLVAIDHVPGLLVWRAQGFLGAANASACESLFVQVEGFLKSLGRGRWQPNSNEFVLFPLEHIRATLAYALGDHDSIVVILPLRFGG